MTDYNITRKITKHFLIRNNLAGPILITLICIFVLLLPSCTVSPDVVSGSPSVNTNTPAATETTIAPVTPTASTVPLLPTNTPYPTSQPQAATISVCASGCDFQTIQAAIDNSGTRDGAIIGIQDEVHTEAGIVVSKSLTIQGSGPEMTIVQAHERASQATDRVFTVSENTKVTFRDLVIQNGYPTETPYVGGGILNFGELSLENCLIRKNKAGDASGIQNRGTMMIINSTLSHNSTDGIGDPGMECGKGGGLVNAFQATLIVHNSLITNNSAEGKGGGLHIACEGNATIINTEISQNKATRNGGGIFLKGTLTLIDSQVTRNGTPADGGGVIVYGKLNYIDSIISGNLSGGNCIIWGDDSYRGKGEMGIENNTIVPDNNCHFK
jgi:predicted outer membrane repeat protein